MLITVRRRAYHKILESLRDHPEEWSFGKYDATRHNMEVWIANRYYGTRFKLGSIHMGEINVLWFLFPWCWWRVRLIYAVEKAQAKVEFKNAVS